MGLWRGLEGRVVGMEVDTAEVVIVIGGREGARRLPVRTTSLWNRLLVRTMRREKSRVP